MLHSEVVQPQARTSGVQQQQMTIHVWGALFEPEVSCGAEL